MNHNTRCVCEVVTQLHSSCSYAEFLFCHSAKRRKLSTIFGIRLFIVITSYTNNLLYLFTECRTWNVELFKFKIKRTMNVSW